MSRTVTAVPTLVFISSILYCLISNLFNNKLRTSYLGTDLVLDNLRSFEWLQELLAEVSESPESEEAA